MQQPRIQAHQINNHSQNSKKRALEYYQDQENYQPSMIKRFSKSFQNSMAFTDINSFGVNSNKFDDFQRDSSVFKQQKRSSRRLEFQKDSQSKIFKMKDLLPIHLSTRLSEEYSAFLRKIADIDFILLKKQSFNCKQAFQNIKMEINQQSDFTLDVTLLKKVNFFDEKYYSFHLDPLKNLVIGLPYPAVSLQIRKYELREKLFDYAISKVQRIEYLTNYKDQIPEKEFEMSKIQLFCPIITKTSKVQNRDKIKLIDAIKKQIINRQALIENKVLIQSNKDANVKEIQELMELVSQIYGKYKVKSMFRINLIDKLLKYGLEIEPIRRNIQIIIRSGTFLKKIALPFKPIICQIDDAQKQSTIQTIIDMLACST